MSGLFKNTVKLISGNRKKKSDTQNRYNTKKYVFAEPFIVFSVVGVKEKRIKKIAETKALYYFNTKDFYYAYKKVKGDRWIVLCAVNTSWNDEDVVKDLEGKHPLILHLKEGKYGIRGEKVVYNVTVEEDSITVKIHNFMLDEYREPDEKDVLPPSSKFIWSLKEKNFGAVILYLIALNLLAVMTFSYSISMKKKAADLLHKAYLQPVRVEKSVVVPSVKSNVTDIFEIVNSVSNKIHGTFYIKKFEYKKNGDILFRLACVEAKCLPPFPTAVFDPKRNEYVYVYRGNTK